MNTVRGVGVDVERAEPGAMGRVSVGPFWRFLEGVGGSAQEYRLNLYLAAPRATHDSP